MALSCAAAAEFKNPDRLLACDVTSKLFRKPYKRRDLHDNSQCLRAGFSPTPKTLQYLATYHKNTHKRTIVIWKKRARLGFKGVQTRPALVLRNS